MHSRRDVAPVPIREEGAVAPWGNAAEPQESHSYIPALHCSPAETSTQALRLHEAASNV